MVAIILFILAISFLVIIHEWGHFFVARKLKMKVEEFGIGFFHRIFAIKRGDTVYSLNLIPLGGFVRIQGETADQTQEDSFYNRPILHRFFVIAAGVAMNFLVFIFLFTIILMLGQPAAISGPTDEYVRDKGVYVFYNSNSAFQDSDLQIWDKITHISTQEELVKVYSLVDIHEFLSNAENDEQQVTLGYTRNNQQHETIVDYSLLQNDLSIQSVTFSQDAQTRQQQLIEYAQQGTLEIFYQTEQGKVTLPTTTQAISRAPDNVVLEGTIYNGDVLENGGVVSFSFFSALWRATISSATGSFAIIKGLGESVVSLISNAEVPDEVAGPVGVVRFVESFEGSSVVLYLQFLAIISLNLAVLNIIPFPALDGGRLLFLAIEGIRGSPISLKAEAWAHNIGFAALLCLIFLITIEELGIL